MHLKAYPNDFHKIENVLIDPYKYVHQGHCAGGWVGPNSNQETPLDCRNECAARSGVEYFAYSNSKTCACYTKCPDDNNHNDHNAYRIIAQGKF